MTAIGCDPSEWRFLCNNAMPQREITERDSLALIFQPHSHSGSLIILSISQGEIRREYSAMIVEKSRDKFANVNIRQAKEIGVEISLLTGYMKQASFLLFFFQAFIKSPSSLSPSKYPS